MEGPHPGESALLITSSPCQVNHPGFSSGSQEVLLTLLFCADLVLKASVSADSVTGNGALKMS